MQLIYCERAAANPVALFYYIRMMKRIVLTLIFAVSYLLFFSQTDSLNAIINSKAHDTVKLKALSELVWLTAGSDSEKALALADQQFELAQKTKLNKFIANAYNDKGIVLIRKSDFQEALKNHQQALALRIKTGNENDIASSYSKIAYCYCEMSNYLAALEPAQKALSIYEKLGQKVYESYMLNTLCNIYVNLRRFDNLRTSAEKSLKIATEMGDKFSMATALNYIATSYESLNKLDEAIKFEERAYSIYKELGDTSTIASSLNNLAYFHRKNYNDKAALKYYLEALDLIKYSNDPNSKAVYLHNIGSIYLSLKNYNASEPFLIDASKLASEQKLSDLQVLIYKSFGDLYVSTGRPDQATKAYTRYMELKDSLFSTETAEKLSEMEVKYETEKKEAANKLLRSENETKTAELSRSRIIQIFLIVGLLLIMLVSYLLYVRYKLKQKQILAKEMLHQQELRSKAVIEAEEKERVRIARELHDGIGQQLSAAKMNISGLEGALKLNTEDEKTMLKNALDLLDESVKEVRAVSHSMMPNALIKSGLVSAVREFINKISSAGNLKINLEIIGLQQRLDPTVENVLFRVLQEIVNNIIKHSRASTVGIQFIKHETELTVLVEDDGVGFNVSEQLNREDAGIGLKNIQSRIEYLNGEVYFDSFPGKGTTITIEIPIEHANTAASI